MNSKHLAILALAVAGATNAGLAQARGAVDVQWSVTIGSPAGVYLPTPVQVVQPAYRPYPAYPVYQPVPVVRPYHHAGWGDADHDGIPNRYDKVYNPRWDRDGDGIPNRYDRRNDRRDDRRDERWDDRRNGRGHGGH